MNNRNLVEVICCKEQGSNNLPSYKDMKRDTPDPEKATILNYLRRGQNHDDLYVWNDDLVSAYEQYNIALPVDFMDHILNHHTERMRKIIEFRTLRKVILDLNFGKKRYHAELSNDGSIIYQSSRDAVPYKRQIEHWDSCHITEELFSINELYMYGKESKRTADTPNTWQITFQTTRNAEHHYSGVFGNGDWEQGCIEKLIDKIESNTALSLGSQYIHMEEELSDKEKRKVKHMPIPTPQTQLTGEFLSAVDNTTNKLIQYETEHNKQDNLLISPVSVMMIMALIGEATRGISRSEIEEFLGIPFEVFRRDSTKTDQLLEKRRPLVSIANGIYIAEASIPFVNKSYINAMKQDYLAEELTGPDPISVINRWVDMKTWHMIPQIANPSMCFDLVLLNAVAFSDKWKKPYEVWDIDDGIFYAASDKAEEVTMLNSREKWYIWDDHCTGFVKPYLCPDFQFMALLPDEGLTPDDLLVKSTTEYYRSAVTAEVDVTMPEFTFDYSMSIKKALEATGLTTIFDPKRADISNMVSLEQSYISDIRQKSMIRVDRTGTKAAAISIAAVAVGCAPMDMNNLEIILDRPFMFAIIHTATGLPLFQGIVRTIKK